MEVEIETAASQRDRARELRRNMTRAERVLWRQLRLRQIYGRKFRRQVPVGPFIVDFLSYDARLIVELDGGQHGLALAHGYDFRRDEFLRRQGFQVLRFWNNDVSENLAGVLARIVELLPTAPS